MSKVISPLRERDIIVDWYTKYKQEVYVGRRPCLIMKIHNRETQEAINPYVVTFINVRGKVDDCSVALGDSFTIIRDGKMIHVFT